MEPSDLNKEMGIEIEPGRSRSIEDDTFSNQDDSFDLERAELKKDEIREDIKKIEREIESITNTLSYGDDERLSFLQNKLDSLKSALLKEDNI